MITDIWTPAGATYEGVTPVGVARYTYDFMMKTYDSSGRPHYEKLHVVANEDISKDYLSELLGNAFETFKQKVIDKHNKRPPTPEEKKEIGKILKEIKEHSKIRMESSNRKIYF